MLRVHADDPSTSKSDFNSNERPRVILVSSFLSSEHMNVWLHALFSSAAVGLIVAFLRAATLGDVVQRYSARSGTSERKREVLDVVDAMREGNHGLTLNRFKQNLSEPAFWRIVFGLWFSISALGFAACAVMIFTD
ncbi:MAG TPA: hypothetical protein VH082_03795 [Rudaea sp.]|nr:hypothetical protein [Rudaea sp.]